MCLVESLLREVNSKYLAVVGNEATRNALRQGHADGLVLAEEHDAAERTSDR